MNKVSIIGLGWFGKELAKALSPNYIVLGSKTSNNSEGSNKDVQNYALDITKEGWELNLENFKESEIVLFNIPPSTGLVPVPFLPAFKRMVDYFERQKTRHFILISSTGVFSNEQLFANEDSTPLPETTSGKILLEAETYLKESEIPTKNVIRPGGLIGGKRHPIFFISGRSEIGGQNHPVNLVHRDDLIGITLAIIKNRPKEYIFHAVSPDHPSKKSYYEEAARFFDLVAPEFSDDQSQGKEVSDSRSSRILDFKYKFNSPFEMLPAIGAS